MMDFGSVGRCCGAEWLVGRSGSWGAAEWPGLRALGGSLGTKGYCCNVELAQGSKVQSS